MLELVDWSDCAAVFLRMAVLHLDGVSVGCWGFCSQGPQRTSEFHATVTSSIHAMHLEPTGGFTHGTVLLNRRLRRETGAKACSP